LDREILIESLEEAGITTKRIHIDAFYAALHRQHYPPLDKFVENYRNESVDPPRKVNQLQKRSHDENVSGRGNLKTYGAMPLRNAVTNRKNKNKKQLPKVFLEYLATTEDFVTHTSRVKDRLTSSDGSTTKLIVELYDGFVVESVLMRYDQKGQGRASLCVSSQCGCAMGCTFCATGTMGLSGNLTTGEILEQLVHADHILAEEYMAKTEPERAEKKIDLVRNVVFMGMGEPLDVSTIVVEGTPCFVLHLVLIFLINLPIAELLQCGGGMPGHD
jgi:sorting nexin-8